MANKYNLTPHKKTFKKEQKQNKNCRVGDLT